MTRFAGTWPLLRLVLRRDRVLLPVWVLVVAAVLLSTVSATAALYPTEAARQGYIDDLARSPLLLAFYGPRPTPELGALVTWRLATSTLIMAAIGVLVVARHTRAEEEAGRSELVRSAAVGRDAGLLAALLAVTLGSLAVAALVAAGMTRQGTPGAGAVALGLAWAAAGVSGGGVGAVAAQVTRGATAARALGLVAVALSFVLRGWGDVALDRGSGPAWLSWTPPLGLAYQVRPYQANRWWALLLAVACTGLLAVAAAVLADRRDLGAGFLTSRPGPAQASARLATPLALAWRLHRPAVYGWAAGLAALGALAGGVADAAGDLVNGNPQLAEVMARLGGPGAATDVAVASTLAIAGLFAAGQAVAAALRMRAEEASGHLEQVLATPVPRLRWITSHLVFALLGPAAGLLACGVAGGITYGAGGGEVARQVPRVVAGALVQLPAVWVLATLAVTAYGLAPRLAPAVGWAALAACAVLGQVGALLGLAGWALDLSPFTHVPHVPGGAVAAGPLLALTAVAAVLAGGGLAAFRARDVPSV